MTNEFKQLKYFALFLITAFLLGVTFSCNSKEKIEKEIQKVGAQLNTVSLKCHGEDSPWFGRMKNFRNYETMEKCMEDGIDEAYQ